VRLLKRKTPPAGGAFSQTNTYEKHGHGILPGSGCGIEGNCAFVESHGGRLLNECIY